MWHKINGKPPVEGIIIVARFEGDKMVAFDTNWACTEGYFGPNNIGWQENIHPTHWMSSKEFREALANFPKTKGGD